MNTKQLFILTGASRGMGLAMAKQLLQPGHTLLCISRQQNPELEAQARATGTTLEQWPLDLAHSREAAAMLQQWLGKPGTPYASATLINNAGLIPAIAPLSALAPDDIALALRVDLEAPMVLTAAFLAATERLGRATQGAQHFLGPGPPAHGITSGLLRRQSRHGPLHTLPRARRSAQVQGRPGLLPRPRVIDIDMQVQLRGADAAAFPDRARFEQLKSGGQLDSPEAAARKVLAFLQHPDFGHEPVTDVRG